MDNFEKIILNLRKEKGLTQEELGNMLGVTSKAVSKWECGKGLPDISLLKEISKIFNISVDDLLKGKKPEKKKSNLLIYVLIILVIFLIIIIILNYKKIPNDNKDDKSYKCTLTANYYVDNITPTNDENYEYIVISEFQVEGIYAIKVSKNISQKLSKGKRYKFTFKTKNNYITDDTNTIFNNSNIINVIESSKDELGRHNICDK